MGLIRTFWNSVLGFTDQNVLDTWAAQPWQRRSSGARALFSLWRHFTTTSSRHCGAIELMSRVQLSTGARAAQAISASSGAVLAVLTVLAVCCACVQ